MTIKEAYDLGLLKVGARIRTNASMDTICCEIVATICSIENYGAIILNKIESGDHTGFTGWRISISNKRAYVEILSVEVAIDVEVLHYITNSIAECLCNGVVSYVKFKNSRMKHNQYTLYTMKCYKRSNFYIEV